MDRNRLIGAINSEDNDGARGASLPARLSAAIILENRRLTDRDRMLLHLLADHRTFTTEQLAQAAFGSLGRARIRLSLLHERDVLDRFRHYTRTGSQSWRWTLGPVGAAMVAAGRGQPMPRPAAVRDATARLSISPTLPHRLAVNGFFVGLLAHARTHDGTRLTRWWNEARCRTATGNLARPDGYGLWQTSRASVPFWVEVDLGTEALGRVVGKLGGYARVARAGRGHPVLFWLATAAREANLRSLLTDAGVPDGLTVTTASVEHGDPAGPVWAVPGRSGRVSLADLSVPTVDGAPWDG